MEIGFYKYHGAGNDFIMIDGRNLEENLFHEERISHLCNRHLGIGADGLILLQSGGETDFSMKYFNSDGREGSMCGNGGRCFGMFLRDLGLISNNVRFEGVDGIHVAIVLNERDIKLQMRNVDKWTVHKEGYFIDTGSPHLVVFVNDLENYDVFSKGSELRRDNRFGKGGTNVNFVEIQSETSFKIRTYERGVEEETLACGTGSVASAIATYIYKKSDNSSFNIDAPGGRLHVSFNSRPNIGFENIWLEGPAVMVYKGFFDAS